MAIVREKKTAVIKKAYSHTYHPDKFKPKSNFIEVDNPIELIDRLSPAVIHGRKVITFDTETYPFFKSSHDLPIEIVRRWVGSGAKARPQDFPFCIAICDGTNAYAIYDSNETGFSKFRQLAPIFEDTTIDKVAHNWKFDAHMLANIGMRIRGRVHDTVILAKLVDENRRSFSLVDLVSDIPESVVEFEHMVNSYKATNKIVDYRQIPRQLMTQYACADVWNCYCEFATEYEKIKEYDLTALYDQECELMIALYAMERYGCTIDKDYEIPLKESLSENLNNAEASIYKRAGRIFNINSTKQLYEVLLDLQVSPGWVPLTEKGNPSLNKSVLDTLANKYNVDIVKDILTFRKYEKLLGTYAVGIYDQRDSCYRIHGNINQTEATTGRMSITKPALQTLPKKDTSIRTAIVPGSDEYQLWFMDLDQIEYRLFAHYAKIPSLIEAIKQGFDVHAATAAMLFNYDLVDLVDKVKKEEQHATEMRRLGKTINFALIYGVGTKHLAELLGRSETAAYEIKANYFAQMPEAQTFIDTVHAVIKQRGYIKNFYGRRRRLKPDEAYKGPNALIQGAAADYIKSKLVNIFKYITYHNLRTKVLLVIHDEIMLLVHIDELHHIPVIRWLLSDFESFRCPITAGVEKGNPSWGHKINMDHVGFVEPTDKGFLDVNVYDGSVFNIYKERMN